MSNPEFRLTKSEVLLVKKYMTRIPDEDLSLLASSLPQSVIGDRAAACEILQKDREIDIWLSLATSANNWFSKVDGLGEFANLEMQSRAKKTEECHS